MGFCRSKRCQDDYFRKYGRVLEDDIWEFETKKNFVAELQQWNDQAVESIVEEFAIEVKKIKPNICISVDGSPKLSFELPNMQGRNELMWAQKGLIDIIFNMDYREYPDLDRLEFIRRELKGRTELIPLLSNYSDTFEHPGKKMVVPSDPERTAKLIRLALLRNQRGIGVYLYSQLNDKQVEALRQAFN